MAIKCAIFDLDGTITDSQRLWYEAKVHVAQRHNLPVTPEITRQFRLRELQGTADYLSGECLPELSRQDVINEILDDVTWHYHNTVTLKPGVAALLERYHRAGVTLCIATGSFRDRFMPMLRKLGIADYFTHVLTVPDDRFPSKHTPEIYLEAARLAEADPADCVIFEDTYYSVKAAKSAGFAVVGIREESSDGTDEEMRASCDYYIGDYLELPQDFLLG